MEVVVACALTIFLSLCVSCHIEGNDSSFLLFFSLNRRAPFSSFSFIFIFPFFLLFYRLSGRYTMLCFQFGGQNSGIFLVFSLFYYFYLIHSDDDYSSDDWWTAVAIVNLIWMERSLQTMKTTVTFSTTTFLLPSISLETSLGSGPLDG